MIPLILEEIILEIFGRISFFLRIPCNKSGYQTINSEATPGGILEGNSEEL